MEPPAFSTAAFRWRGRGLSRRSRGCVRIAAIEAFEDMRQGCRIDAFALVANCEFDRAVLQGGVQLNLRLWRTVLDGVHHEI